MRGIRGGTIRLRRDFFFEFFFLLHFDKGFRAQLTREIFDGGDDSRGGPVHRVADHGKFPVPRGIENPPPRDASDPFETSRRNPSTPFLPNSTISLHLYPISH